MGIETISEFQEYYSKWLFKTYTRKTALSNDLSVRRFLEELGEDLPLTDITKLHVDTSISSLSKQLTKSTLANYTSRLKTAFKRAKDWGLIKENPFEHYYQTKRWVKERKKCIPPFEMEEFLQGIEDINLRWFITAAFATGRMRQELMDLTWDDVDLVERKFYMQSRWKNERNVYVINPVFLNLLLNIQAEDGSEGLVFKHFGHADSITHKVKEELKKAGYGQFNLNSFRYSYEEAMGSSNFFSSETESQNSLDLKVPYSHPLRRSKEAGLIYIEKQTSQSESKIEIGDFEGAITNARTALEAIFNTIEEKLSDDPPQKRDGDLVKQFKRVQRLLDLEPGQPNIETPLRQVLSGLNSIVSGISGMSNQMGDRHANMFQPTEQHAELVLNSTKTLANFLFSNQLFRIKE